MCFSARCQGFGCTATGLPAQVVLSAECCPLSTEPHQITTGPQTQGLKRISLRNEKKSQYFYIVILCISSGRCTEACVNNIHNLHVHGTDSNLLFIDGNTLYPKKQFHSSPSCVCLHLSGTTPPQYLMMDTREEGYFIHLSLRKSQAASWNVMYC